MARLHGFVERATEMGFNLSKGKPFAVGTVVGRIDKGEGVVDI